MGVQGLESAPSKMWAYMGFAGIFFGGPFQRACGRPEGFRSLEVYGRQMRVVGLSGYRVLGFEVGGLGFGVKGIL